METPTQESVDRLIITAHRKGYKWGWVAVQAIQGKPTKRVPRSEWKRGKDSGIPWDEFFEHKFLRCPDEMEARSVAAWMAKQMPKLNNFLFAHFEKNENLLLRAVSIWPEKPAGHHRGATDKEYTSLKAQTKSNNAKMKATRLTIQSVKPVNRGDQWGTVKAVRSK